MTLPDFELVNDLKNKLAAQMPVVQFSKAGNIGDISVPVDFAIG